MTTSPSVDTPHVVAVVRSAAATFHASSGLPSCRVTPGLRWKRHRAPPGSDSHEIASSGRTPPVGSIRTSVSKHQRPQPCGEDWLRRGRSGQWRDRGCESSRASGFSAVPPYWAGRDQITPRQIVAQPSALQVATDRRKGGLETLHGVRRRGRGRSPSQQLRQARTRARSRVPAARSASLPASPFARPRVKDEACRCARRALPTTSRCTRRFHMPPSHSPHRPPYRQYRLTFAFRPSGRAHDVAVTSAVRAPDSGASCGRGEERRPLRCLKRVAQRVEAGVLNGQRPRFALIGTRQVVQIG